MRDAGVTAREPGATVGPRDGSEAGGVTGDAGPAMRDVGVAVGARRTAVVGLGLSSSATAGDVVRCAEAALRSAGLAWADVARIATLAALVPDPRVRVLGRPVVGFEPSALAAVSGTQVSARALGAVGTPSVAEAAALLAAGAGAVLVAPKRRDARVTAAVAVPD